MILTRHCCACVRCTTSMLVQCADAGDTLFEGETPLLLLPKSRGQRETTALLPAAAASHIFVDGTLFSAASNDLPLLGGNQRFPLALLAAVLQIPIADGTSTRGRGLQRLQQHARRVRPNQPGQEQPAPHKGALTGECMHVCAKSCMCAHAFVPICRCCGIGRAHQASPRWSAACRSKPPSTWAALQLPSAWQRVLCRHMHIE